MLNEIRAKKDHRAALTKAKRKQKRDKINDQKETINLGLFKKIKLNVELEVNKAELKEKQKNAKRNKLAKSPQSDSSHDGTAPKIREGKVILKDDYVDKLNESAEDDLSDLRKAQK